MMTYILVLFLINILVGCITLWIAAGITRTRITIKEIFLAILGSSAIGAVADIIGIPSTIGWILSTIVLFFLIKKFSLANIWPNILIMVIVSAIISYVIKLFLIPYILTLV